MSRYQEGPDRFEPASKPAADRHAHYFETMERQVAWAHRGLFMLAILVIVASLVFG